MCLLLPGGDRHQLTVMIGLETYILTCFLHIPAAVSVFSLFGKKGSTQSLDDQSDCEIGSPRINAWDPA